MLPDSAGSLRLAVPERYVFKSKLLRGAMSVVDALGSLALAPAAKKVDWAQVRRIAIVRTDHLGDLLQTLPALRRLRRALPKARLDLWVGPWGRELASLFTDVDQVRITAAPWFDRAAPRKLALGALRDFRRQLSAEAYDASFELRGDLRQHLALWGAAIPVRAGQTLTGGAFLLSHPASWNGNLHEQEQNLSLLDQAGVPAATAAKAPYLKLPVSALREAVAVTKALKLGRRPVLIQAASGAQAKRWSPEAWAKVLNGLPASLPVALLGSKAEVEEMQGIAKRGKRPVANAAGKLSLSGLAAFVAPARLVMSVDSGPAHLAAVQGVPVLSLFSGTNRASQWAPRGPKVQVLQADGFPCSPCELSVCPYGNACMQAIDSKAVLQAARKLLRAA